MTPAKESKSGFRIVGISQNSTPAVVVGLSQFGDLIFCKVRRLPEMKKKAGFVQWSDLDGVAAVRVFDFEEDAERMAERYRREVPGGIWAVRVQQHLGSAGTQPKPGKQ